MPFRAALQIPRNWGDPRIDYAIDCGIIMVASGR